MRVRKQFRTGASLVLALVMFASILLMVPSAHAAPRPPVANFTLSPAYPVVLQNMTLDASSSYDPGNLSLNYTWDFDTLDGISTDAQGRVVKHTFDRAGIFEVQLTVDNGKLSAICTKEVYVYADRQYDPVAIIKTPLNVTTIQAKAGAPVQFDAGMSYDPNSEQLIYLWDFGDGGNSSLSAPSHVYGDTGQYLVTLTVSTPNGDMDSTFVTVVVGSQAGRPTDTGDNGISWGWVLFFIILGLVLTVIVVAGAFLLVMYQRYRRHLAEEEVSKAHPGKPLRPLSARPSKPQATATRPPMRQPARPPAARPPMRQPARPPGARPPMRQPARPPGARPPIRQPARPPGARPPMKGPPPMRSPPPQRQSPSKPAGEHKRSKREIEEELKREMSKMDFEMEHEISGLFKR